MILSNWRLLIGVAFVLTIVSCRKEEGPTAGIEIHPNEEQVGLFSTDTFTIECWTQRLDSVRTDGYTYQSVGSYSDPEFGLANNGLVTQYRLSSEGIDVNQLQSFTVDSVVLAMVYQSYYGGLEAQNFRVYKNEESLLPDTSYYSNHDLNKGALIGELLNNEPNPNVTYTEGSEEQPSQLRIPLINSFGRELFDASALTYSSNEEFLKVFKGLVVESELVGTQPNTGGQFAFNLENDYSRLLVYYTTPAGTQDVLEYLINDECIKFNTSKNDYTGSNVGASFDSKIAGRQRVYTQAMGGVVTVIKIPHIKQLTKNGPVLINRAKITLSMENGSNVYFNPLPELFAFGIKEEGGLFDTPDRSETHFDGKFTDELEYELTMTRYYQQIINGNYEENGLMIMELADNFGRSVIAGPDAGSTPLKFEISYTPIN